jgi:hypothetical protein
MVIRFKYRVSKVNIYLKCVSAQQARVGKKVIDGTTWCG